MGIARIRAMPFLFLSPKMSPKTEISRIKDGSKASVG